MRAKLAGQMLSRLLAVATGFWIGGAIAQEAVVTLRSTVTGNQEQPKVMYIVPWQQPGNSEFEYRMESTIADELFAPVDRDEFVRELGYKSMLNAPQPNEASGQ